MWLRGLITLVKTMLGPQKTSSSRMTPVYKDTLFWILTLSPTTTSEPIKTFWPTLHFRPLLAGLQDLQNPDPFFSIRIRTFPGGDALDEMPTLRPERLFRKERHRLA